MNGVELKEFGLLKEKPFTASDRMLVSHLQEDWGESNYWILFAAALCSLAVREGHAYLDLSQPRAGSFSLPKSWPAQETWEAMLAASPIVRGENDATTTPLVFCSGSALFLEKYYSYEKELAGLLRSRAAAAQPNASASPVDRAAASRFFVITGGPGTGKTTLALQYLDALLDSWSQTRPPRFAAIAPTGKAAARLAESISAGVQRMEVSAPRRESLLAIPCLTIHRLLGSLPHRSTFRKNEARPLRFDTLVIDESSMIDLPLMLKLFRAVPEDCQVLLLGDKDQLSSVDVGSVLHDILSAAEQPTSPLAGCVERLSKTYRFSEDSGIFRACLLAREGATDAFSEMLEETLEDFSFHPMKADLKRIPQRAVKRSFEHWRSLAKKDSPEAALSALSAFIALCPTRQGAFGSVEFNRQVERLARNELELDPARVAPIHGSPLIVLENNYELELFNGDIGITWIDAAGEARAFFATADGMVKHFRLSELPRSESAFALTIHKSQGSEFAETLCLFAPDADRNLTRELVYTAFSRAKERLVVLAAPDSLCEAIKRQAARTTRLGALLLR